MWLLRMLELGGFKVGLAKPWVVVGETVKVKRKTKLGAVET